jgi:hypothetical protein
MQRMRGCLSCHLLRKISTVTLAAFLAGACFSLLFLCECQYFSFREREKQRRWRKGETEKSKSKGWGGCLCIFCQEQAPSFLQGDIGINFSLFFPPSNKKGRGKGEGGMQGSNGRGGGCLWSRQSSRFLLPQYNSTLSFSSVSVSTFHLVCEGEKDGGKKRLWQSKG